MDKLKQAVSNQVFEGIRDQILNETLKPDDSLPSERQLVDIYQVNRGAVREALQRLQQLGLIETLRGGGSKVLNYQHNAGLELLVHLVSSGEGVNTQVARSLIEMRTALGVDATRLAVGRMTPEFATKLRQQYSLITNCLSSKKPVAEQALKLWLLIIRASQNIGYQLAYNTLEKAYSTFDNQLEPLLQSSINIGEYNRLVCALENKRESEAIQAAQAILDKDARALYNLLDVYESILAQQKAAQLESA